jgi:ribosome production factor 2|uniref:Ribosome production factor 2 homolog n=1 Tax=Panagrolaimus sp. PS1159 TaxID=55785 RepID=A0AC35FN57_9BILA
MAIMAANGAKPKTRKGKRFLENRASKIHENDKRCLAIHGAKTSPILNEVLEYLYLLKKPLSQHLRRHNAMHLFEDETLLEKFSAKFDASLFAFGSHQKKRPNTLIFGRMFDHHILDMFEMRITNYIPAKTFKQPPPILGAKPCILLQGTLFESDEEIKRLGNLMVDWFRGVKVPNIRLQGLETVISFTIVEGVLLFRVYRTQLKKSASKTPRVELIEIGPSIDFVLDRKKIASDSLYKSAMRVPDELRVKPRKNVSQDVFGTQKARIHLGRQEIGRIQTRKTPALRKAPRRQTSGANSIPLGE